MIGSTSTGGDTYQNAAILAEALSEHLGVNIRVDPVGASDVFKALARDSRGTTIMVFHDRPTCSSSTASKARATSSGSSRSARRSR